MNICILGSGSWGCAIASLLAGKGNSVEMWCFDKLEYEMLSEFHVHKKFLPDVKLPKSISYTMDIDEAVKGKDIIVIAVPSFAVGSTVSGIKNSFQKNQIIVNLAKGFEEKTLSFLSDVIKRELGSDVKLCMLSGPSHAEEVGKKLPTTIVAASESEEIAKTVQDVFMCDYFRVYTSNDIIGVELGGALKNVISLCAGVSDGLGYGDNIKAAIMTRGMAEIVRLGEKMGGKRETFFGLTGMGDLIVTCTSMHSRNRRCGILIGNGMPVDEAINKIGMVVEGIVTCKSAYKLAQKYGVEMPIVEEAHNVLYGGCDIANSMTNLMLRDKKAEEMD